MSNPIYAGTSSGPNRRSLTLEESQEGQLPIPLTKAEWKTLHSATKVYAQELNWREFQYFLQRVERSKEKREREESLLEIVEKIKDEERYEQKKNIHSIHYSFRSEVEKDDTNGN